VTDVATPSSGPKRTGTWRTPRTILTVVIVLVVVLVAILSAFLYFNGLLGENPRYSHSFYLTIEPDSTSVFTIICPVPTNLSGSLCPNFVNEIEVVSGDPEYLLVENEHGTGLRVSGSGYTKLTWEGKWKVDDGDWYLNMTMTNAPCQWDYDEPAEGFWAWVGSEDASVHIRMTYSAERIHNESPMFVSGGGPCFSLSMTTSGNIWEQAVLDYGWVVIN
jgi:hypothetical protein